MKCPTCRNKMERKKEYVICPFCKLKIISVGELYGKKKAQARAQNGLSKQQRNLKAR